VDEKNLLAKQFEAHRARLRGVAYRLLGSATEADDAVQEAWLRLSRTGEGEIDNLGGWLTTVVARICLDQLRMRKTRHEEAVDAPDAEAEAASESDPEREVLLADSVGLALLVMLNTLAPAERVALVLHDMFDLSFDEIAPIIGRSAVATRQLASRARRRVQGAQVNEADLGRQRGIVDAFLAASRSGDVEALLAVLDPNVVLRSDPTAIRMGNQPEMRGATAVASFFKGRAAVARSALLDGQIGVVVAPGGRLLVVLRVTLAGDKIAEIEAIADPEHLGRLNLVVPDADA
jgi:RNA polymerase sigma-70 factor (ECF subfamily)